MNDNIDIENEISQINSRIYITSRLAAQNLEKLKSKNIKYILALYEERIPKYVRNMYRDNNIEYVQILIEDSPFIDISEFFLYTNNFIKNSLKKKNGSVLVHCNMGVSRSCSIVLAYLLYKLYKMKKKYPKDIILFELLKRVREKRPICGPNGRFMEQLKRYEENLRNEIRSGS
jgi:protein-tyrosine phosphatase